MKMLSQAHSFVWRGRPINWPLRLALLPLSVWFTLCLSFSAPPSVAQTVANPVDLTKWTEPPAGPKRPDSDTNNDEWLRFGYGHLELIQHCLKQVAPGTPGFIEQIIRFSHARGGISTQELHQFLAQLKTASGAAALALLDEPQASKSFKAMGLKLDAKGFNAATYTVPNRSVFYAVKSNGHCVLEIKTPAASLGQLLQYGGLFRKVYNAADQRQHDVIFPRKFKDVDSVNLRILHGTWQDDKFTGSFVMRGNYGVDNDQLSRLDVEQEYGRMRIVMTPTKEQDWKRLGMDSASSEWPVSESLQIGVAGFINAVLEPNQQSQWIATWWKDFERYPFEVKPDLWPNAYLTEGFKKQIPTTMYAPSPSSPIAVAKGLTMAFAAIPKNYRIPTSVDLLVVRFYGGRQFTQRHPHKEDREKGYLSLVLLSPKANEGAAKGLSTYRLEGEPNGVRKAYELIIKTKGALPDDKLDSFAQMRLLPAEPAVKNKKR
jgi:hypothetical protein